MALELQQPLVMENEKVWIPDVGTFDRFPIDPCQGSVYKLCSDDEAKQPVRNLAPFFASGGEGSMETIEIEVNMSPAMPTATSVNTYAFIKAANVQWNEGSCKSATYTHCEDDRLLNIQSENV